MHIVYIILGSFSIIYGFARGEEEVQRVVTTAHYYNTTGVHEYRCYYHNRHRPCSWLKDGQAFDPTEYGYYHEIYLWTRNNCNIKPRPNVTTQLHEGGARIQCLALNKYPRTVVKARLKSSVELECLTWNYGPGGSKWNRAIARYSYINYDYAIRIHSVEMEDFGEWKCTRVEQYVNDEIIAAYTLVFNNESVTESTEVDSESIRGSETTPKTIETTTEAIGGQQHHEVMPWINEYDDGSATYHCELHERVRSCTWFKDGNAFDPTKYGYHYDPWARSNNCTIIPNDLATYRLHDHHERLRCLTIADYPNTTVTTELKLNVELKCQSHLRIWRCVWKRNDVSVDIGGRYSYPEYARNHNRTYDCSIRIDSIENADFGEWTCNQRLLLSKFNEIIAAYVLVFDIDGSSKEMKSVERTTEVSSEESGNWDGVTTIDPRMTEATAGLSEQSLNIETATGGNSITSGDLKSQNSFSFSSNLMIAVYVCIVIVIAIIFALILKMKWSLAKEKADYSSQTILHIQYTTDRE